MGLYGILLPWRNRVRKSCTDHLNIRLPESVVRPGLVDVLLPPVDYHLPMISALLRLSPTGFAKKAITILPTSLRLIWRRFVTNKAFLHRGKKSLLQHLSSSCACVRVLLHKRLYVLTFFIFF